MTLHVVPTTATDPPMTPRTSTDLAREIVRRSTALAPAPSLFRLETELRDAGSNVAEVARLIERSPALAALVLRMANSVFYSPRQPVVALPRAVVMLGDVVLRQIVLHSIVTGRRTTPRAPDDAVAAAHLTADAVRCAVVARDLAWANRSASPDEAFVGGLLHDIGQLMLLDERPGTYGRYLSMRRPADPLDVERAVTGTTHEEVGAAFAAAWNLPTSLAAVLRSHHDPFGASLAAIIRASDLVVPGLSRPGEAWDEEGRILIEAELDAVGVDPVRWINRVPRLREEIGNLLNVFAVAA